MHATLIGWKLGHVVEELVGVVVVAAPHFDVFQHGGEAWEHCIAMARDTTFACYLVGLEMLRIVSMKAFTCRITASLPFEGCCRSGSANGTSDNRCVVEDVM